MPMSPMVFRTRGSTGAVLPNANRCESLMASRSLSPYLQPGEVKGRSPYPKHLTGSMLGAGGPGTASHILPPTWGQALAATCQKWNVRIQATIGDQARFCQPSAVGQVFPAVSATDTGERFSSHGNQGPAHAIPIDDPTLAKQEPRTAEHLRPDADGQALPAMDAPSAAEDTSTRVCNLADLRGRAHQRHRM